MKNLDRLNQAPLQPPPLLPLLGAPQISGWLADRHPPPLASAGHLSSHHHCSLSGAICTNWYIFGLALHNLVQTIEWWVNSVQEISSYDQAQWRCKRKPTGGFVCGAAVESLVCVTAPPDPQVEGGRWWERNWWRAGRPQLSPKTTCLDLSAHGLIWIYGILESVRWTVLTLC